MESIIESKQTSGMRSLLWRAREPLIVIVDDFQDVAEIFVGNVLALVSPKAR